MINNNDDYDDNDNNDSHINNPRVFFYSSIIGERAATNISCFYYEGSWSSIVYSSQHFLFVSLVNSNQEASL